MGNRQSKGSDEPVQLGLEELSGRTGEPVERLAEWQSLGLIGAANRDAFAPEDVERVRLVQLLLRGGIGMELGTAEIAASLSLAGEERAFCSEKCLRRFVASPERYSA